METINVEPTRVKRKPGEHRETCLCKTCRGRKMREAQGLPTMVAVKRARKEAFAASLVGQIERGELPDTNRAAIDAGYPPETAAANASTFLSDESVRNEMKSALAKRGLTPDVLATLATQSLSAEKFWRNRNPLTGNIDERADPDWHERGAWFDRVAKLLGITQEAQLANGNGAPQVNVQRALVIVHLPEPARAPGHPQTCQCPECSALWEEKAQRMLERRRDIMKRYGIE